MNMNIPKSWAHAFALFALVALPLSAVQAGPVEKRVMDTRVLKVCIWPDYYGISFRDQRSRQLVGIDIDLAMELGKDLAVKVEFVDSDFGRFMQDLANDQCDVAMFAVGVTAARAANVQFTRPYMHSDIYAMTLKSSRGVRQWADIDRPGVNVAVLAGTYMEPVMKERLKQATLVVVRPPGTREAELESGRVDVFMTDYPYSRKLLGNADWLRMIAPPEPFFVLPYAYAVKRGDPQWLATVDRFVERIKRDGRLRAAAQRHGLSAIIARD